MNYKIIDAGSVYSSLNKDPHLVWPDPSIKERANRDNWGDWNPAKGMVGELIGCVSLYGIDLILIIRLEGKGNIHYVPINSQGCILAPAEPVTEDPRPLKPCDYMADMEEFKHVLSYEGVTLSRDFSVLNHITKRRMGFRKGEKIAFVQVNDLENATHFLNKYNQIFCTFRHDTIKFIPQNTRYRGYPVV